MRALPIACPAATAVSPPGHGASVLCGVLALANDGAHIGGVTARGQISPLMSGRRDPNVVRYRCAGQGVPGSDLSYCACEFWRAQRDADQAGRRGPNALRDDAAGRIVGGPDQRVSDALATLGN